jgi:hypothetical protein
MRGAIPPLQFVFMVWCLVKHGDNFTFTFIFVNDGASASLNNKSFPTIEILRYHGNILIVTQGSSCPLSCTTGI